MLVLLMYNMVGYSITYFVERCVSGPTIFEDIIGENIDWPNFIIKVPINTPNQKHWSSTAMIDNNLEGSGQFYRITDQQIVDDTLYVYCQYDQAAREHYVDLVSKIEFSAIADTNSFPSDNHSKVLRHFVKDYLCIQYRHIFFILQWALDDVSLNARCFEFISGFESAVALPPPEIA